MAEEEKTGVSEEKKEPVEGKVEELQENNQSFEGKGKWKKIWGNHKKFENNEGDATKAYGDDFPEDEEDLKEHKKMRRVLGFGVGILILAVVVLAACVVYSQNLNKNLAAKTAEIQDEYKKLQDYVSAQPTSEPTPEPTDTPSPEAEPKETKSEPEEKSQNPIESNEEAVQQNLEQQSQGDENSDDKVITSPDNNAEFVTYENYIEGKKFSFQYPSSWDGKVIFANVTQDDGTVVITCYHGAQYGDHQNGAGDTGEIFQIVVNKNTSYQSESNAQYKMSEKDGYCGYYEEPSGVTYDYVNHPEYAEVYKLVYDSQGKIWRSFNFN